MSDWKIARRGGACSGCEREFDEGEPHVSKLFLRGAEPVREDQCQECFAKPLCAGGCYHEAHVRYGDSGAPNIHYCDWIRSWTDIGLSAYARIMEKNPAYFARFETA